MAIIFILKLENQKYYIGKTLIQNFNLKTNFNRLCSDWTKKYKPIKILELISNCSDCDEDIHTLKYMKIYGINNVRGGRFSELKLNKDNLIVIKKMIASSMDNCYICGEYGHFPAYCNNDHDKIIKEFNYLLSNKSYVYDKKKHYSTRSTLTQKYIDGGFVDDTHIILSSDSTHDTNKKKDDILANNVVNIIDSDYSEESIEQLSNYLTEDSSNKSVEFLSKHHVSGKVINKLINKLNNKKDTHICNCNKCKKQRVFGINIL
jgi:hypothetical protein